MENNTFTPEQDPEDFGLENPEEDLDLEDDEIEESEEGEIEEDLSKAKAVLDNPEKYKMGLKQHINLLCGYAKRVLGDEKNLDDGTEPPTFEDKLYKFGI